MFTIRNLSILAFVLPITTVLASSHGKLLNRHHEIAQRQTHDADNVTLVERGGSSRWSFYETQTGNAGSCGHMLSDSGFTVAMNQAQMNDGWCGKSIRMTCNGKSTSATIEDTCPGCPYNGLDLSPGLFSFFADQGAGIIYGDWEFGSGAPAPPPPPPPPPKPKPTTTWTPPPPPKTTSVWHAPTTSSKPPAPTSSASSTTPSSSSKSSSASASSSASESAKVAAPSPPAGPQNIAGLYQAFVQVGGVIAGAANA